MKIIFLFIMIFLIIIIFTQTSYAESIQKGMFNQTLGENKGFFTPQNNESNNRMIILLNDTVTQKDIDHFTNNKLKVIRTYTLIPAILVEIPSNVIGGMERMNSVAKENSKTMSIFPDELVHGTLSNSIPQIQGGIPFNVGINGDNIRVCVVDTGVNDSHPNMPTLVAEYDFVNNDGNANDDHGHGTNVAGIIASNHATYRGVAPNVSLMAAKVLDFNSSGFSSDVMLGIQWCVDNNADVINLSLGSNSVFPSTCDTYPTSITANSAVNSGVVTVVATGNNSCDFFGAPVGCVDAIAAPACASNVIAVGAVDDLDGRTLYANEGSELDIVAPGTITAPSFTGSGFSGFEGTSQASPHVAGAAALILQKFPTYTVQQVKDALYDNSVDLGTAGFDTIYGNGRLDVSFLNSFCSPPVSGTWTLTTSCTMTASATAQGNVLVQNNSVLTIPSGITLDVNFSSFNLTVKSGSGVLVESGGKIT